MQEISQKKETSLHLSNRETLLLTGILDVISFDEMRVYLVTENGNLLVEGIGLHITALDVASGNMTVEGNVFSMIYSDKENGKKGGFFSRLTK